MWSLEFTFTNQYLIFIYLTTYFMENLKQFIGTCVENPFDSLEELNEVIDNAKEINAKEFVYRCDVDSVLLRDFILFPNSFRFYYH